MGIIAYDVEKAERAFKEGADSLELSIEKWESIEDALIQLGNEAIDLCGMCFKCERSDCGGCILFEGKSRTCVEEQVKCIHTAAVSARAMVEKLMSLHKKSVKP